MITLKMVHDTINDLRERAAMFHRYSLETNDHEDPLPTAMIDDLGLALVVFPPVDSGPCIVANLYYGQRADAVRLAMAWHDVARGCRDELDLQMRIAEMAESACVELFRADREAALIRG